MFFLIFNLRLHSPKIWTPPPSALLPSTFLIWAQVSKFGHQLVAVSFTTNPLRWPPLPRLILCKMARATGLPSPPVLRTRQATHWLRTRLGTSRLLTRLLNSLRANSPRANNPRANSLRVSPKRVTDQRIVDPPDPHLQADREWGLLLAPRPFSCLIHRSAWKGYSPKFAGTEFSEVASAVVSHHTHLVTYRAVLGEAPPSGEGGKYDAAHRYVGCGGLSYGRDDAERECPGN